jgi:hypothetical protein
LTRHVFGAHAAKLKVCCVSCLDAGDRTAAVFQWRHIALCERADPFFYRVLDSIFLTNTLLFVGYSLSDPDIQLVLENASIAANSSHPHYAVMPDNIHPSIKSSIQRAYNIQFVEFEAGEYHQVESGLKELADEIALYRTTHVT